jgi:hypothetical protein
MRKAIVLLCVLMGSLNSAFGQIRIGIGLPNVSIGINVPVFPQLVQVPNYPVYYAPQLRSNYFFYDGLYWVYQSDNWYASYWYNGPWGLVAPAAVPLFVLRIPVRYYRDPPAYFRGWQREAPPRWDEHWGRDWEKQRPGWDQWNRRSVPPAAPPPIYQRQYSGDRYPSVEERQQDLHSRNYRYQPHDEVVRQHYQEQLRPRTPSPPGQRQSAQEPGRGKGQDKDRDRGDERGQNRHK